MVERNDLLDWIRRLDCDSDDQARILLFGAIHGSHDGDDDDRHAGTATQCHRGNRRKRIHFRPHGIHRQREACSTCQSFSPRHVDAAGLICKRRAGYDFTEASCIPSLRHTVIPDAVHPWRKGPHGQPTLPRHELQRLLQHRLRTFVGSDADHMEFRRIRNATGTPYTIHPSSIQDLDSRTLKKYKDGNAPAKDGALTARKFSRHA